MTDPKELMLDVGLANELKMAFRKGGWTNADLKKFCEKSPQEIRQLLLCIRGLATPALDEFRVDTDARPLHHNLAIERHDPMGVVNLTGDGECLFVDTRVVTLVSVYVESAEFPVWQVGELPRALVGKKMLNANLLKQLLQTPQLIPRNWDAEPIAFWGTEYYHHGVSYYQCLTGPKTNRVIMPVEATVCLHRGCRVPVLE